jgi:LysM repeat protein
MAVGKLAIPDEAKNESQTEEKVVYASNNGNADIETNPTETLRKTPITKYPEGEFKINDTKVIFVKQGTSFLTIAKQYDIPLAKLFEYNDITQIEVAETDQLVYLQKKRKTSLNEFHMVAAGETLNSIAQTEAIRLDCLLEYNNLTAGMQPTVGEKLTLCKKSSIIPKLVSSKKVL